MTRTLLIDADILVYTVASAAEVPIDWGEDVWTLHSHFDEAVASLESKITQLKEIFSTESMIFALTTTERNFRKDIYPLYKSNRKAVRKPLVWKPLRAYLHEKYRAVERPGLEGDDCLGILATKTGPLWPGAPAVTERILVSIDKDFKTIPCTYYNLNTKETMVISEQEANHWHMMQTLTGDTTDGYPGCPGIGPKRAGELLDGLVTVPHMWSRVVAAYKAKELGESVALQQARCARILRACDYDFKNKKPILWEPR